MTNAQESQNGHHSFPPPSSVENPSQTNLPDLPTDKANNNQLANDGQVAEREQAPFPANAYHVPPKHRTPKAHAYRFGDSSSPGGIDTTPSPERCQFMFSDGRQCTMGRYEIHPSLCRYHYEREEQLFGPPGSVGALLGRELDLPELYSACRDLSNPAGVHRALAQVFRLLAQRRISRQEAATFAKLGHLLLQSIFAMSAEVVERQKRVAITPFLPHEEVQVVECQKAVSARESLPAANSPEPLPAGEIESNSRNMNTSAKLVSNSPEINTSEITRLKVAQNQHLHKNGGGEAILDSRSIKLSRGLCEGARRVDNHENGRKT